MLTETGKPAKGRDLENPALNEEEQEGTPSGILLGKAGDPGRVSMPSVVAKPGRPASHKWGVPKCCIPPNGARGSTQHIIPCLSLEILGWKRIQGPALLANSEDALHLDPEALQEPLHKPSPPTEPSASLRIRPSHDSAVEMEVW